MHHHNMSRASKLFILLALATCYATMAEENAEVQILEANNQFNNEMYKSLSKTPGNVFFSPLSAHACLSMLYQSAAGTTKQAFASTLRIPEPSLAAEGYDTIMHNLNNASDVTLAIANKVYVLEGRHLKEDFKNAVTQKFQSEVENVNFADSDAAAEAVNSWVKEKTKEKIDKLFEPSDFNEDTRAVLVNAIYFKGVWQNKFVKSSTKNEPFYTDETNKVDIPMMHVSEEFYHKEDTELNAKVLQMPYSNQNFKMIVVLPNEKNGIGELETKLANYDLNKLDEGLEWIGVRVTLPKFKFETKIDLQDTLTEMGLGVIFGGQCDISGLIEESEPLYISKAIQKAFIEVNEEGAEAAASSGAEASARFGRVIFRWTTFEANHPFVFMIASKQSQKSNILFYGSLRDPTTL